MSNTDLAWWIARQFWSMSLQTANEAAGYGRKALASNPDLTSILLMLLILYVSLLILTHATRMMYAIVKSMVRTLLVVIILGGILWVCTRGIDGIYRDAMMLFDEATTEAPPKWWEW